MPVRPPSERDVEHELLDSLDMLHKILKSSTYGKPEWQHYPASPNWWDVLPGGVGEMLKSNGYQNYIPLVSSRSDMYPLAKLKCVQMQDRIELSLISYENEVFWQRTLFFEKPSVQ